MLHARTTGSSRSCLGSHLVAATWLALGLAHSALAGEVEISQAAPVPERLQAGVGTADTTWLGSVQRGLAQREYHASQNAAGLQAPNRAHNLRTYFEASRIRVHDRTAPGSPELLALSLSGVGRVGQVEAVPPGTVVSDGNRVEVRRDGLVEWYANSTAGLEQGFTLAKAPAGDGPLSFEIAVAGAKALHAGDAVIFRTPTGRRLRYGKLAAEDANGRDLPAELQVVAGSRVRLLVDDTEALYPIVVDPLLTEISDSELFSAQLEARMGFSVASAGDVNGDGYADVIVGARNYDSGESDEGAAFVFHGSASGIPSGDSLDADSRIESDQADARLGQSVAGAGDVNGDGYDDVIVGAYLYDAPESNEGAAFVFLGGASGLLPLADPGDAVAQLESNQAGAQMGWSVAGAGDVDGDGYADVIVGAYRYDVDGGSNEGAAFVFHGAASGVLGSDPASAAAQLDTQQDDAELGWSVAGAGDLDADGYADVLVGAPSYDDVESDEGAAFIFLGSSTGVGSADVLDAAAQIESNQDDAELGWSVAGAGDVNGDGYADVIVGARRYDAGETDEGAAFVFHGGVLAIDSGGPLSADATFESDQASAQLGFAVGGAGDVNGDGYADVIVGAIAFDAPFSGEGAAFVLLGGPTGVSGGAPSDAFAQLEGNEASAEFGRSVAGAGDVDGDGYADVIVGAPLFDSTPTDGGAAFVYRGGASGVVEGDPSSAAAQLESDQVGALLGSSVSGAGDVNGDGYADVVVGAPLYDAGEPEEGAAFVFLGSAAGIATGNPASAAAQLESDQDGAELGSSVAGAGDVNGDGYADVIVGARFYNGSTGSAFVFLGSTVGIVDGDPTTAATQLNSDHGQLGFSVAGAGDVNGDGYADVIVGAPGYQAGEFLEGAAFVFLGSAEGIEDGSVANAAAQLESNQEAALMGWSVAGAGDVNGDGYGDVIVGARDYDSTPFDGGAAFVFLGSATGIADGNPVSAATRLLPVSEDAWMGASVAGAGDVNGDGYADVIVGAPKDASPGSGGIAYVYHGSATGIADALGFGPGAVFSLQFGSQLGQSVAGAGDVNGDGYADVIVGVNIFDLVASAEGAASVVLGSPTGVGIALFTAAMHSNQIGAELGTSVAGAGDVNGDGYADVIVGAPGYDAPDSNEGAAFVFLGNGDGDGRPVLAQQLRGGASPQPVEVWGRSHDATEFQVSLRATHPEGRGRVKLEVEVCAAGLAFGDPACASHVGATWDDVTATSGGVTLTETIGSLTTDVLHRWRARVLHAPFRVSEPGIAPPPNPAHGPWRRVSAQAREADVLITAAPAPCNNGVDDDGDGAIDFPSDPGCSAASDPSERDPLLPCDDGEDNDGDGRADFDPVTKADVPNFAAGTGDVGCFDPAYFSETPQCQDGLNNDNDGLIDWDGGASAGVPIGMQTTPDLQCVDRPWKNKERVGCGLGFELVFLLAPLIRLRRRSGLPSR